MVKQILVWIYHKSYTCIHATCTATVAINVTTTIATLSMTSELAATHHVATDYIVTYIPSTL